MENKRTKNILIYDSIWDSIGDMTQNQIAELFIAISDWRLGIEPSFTEPTTKILFRQQLPLLEKQQKNYITKIENGKKGGAPTGNQNAIKQPKTTENNLNQAETTENKHIEKEKEKDKENKNNKESNISSGKEVLVEKENNIFNLVYHSFIKSGYSPQEAKENTKDAIKLKTDEELKVLFNIE